MKFKLGDRVKVIQNCAGDLFSGVVGETGTVVGILGSPNEYSGYFPAVVYIRDDDLTSVALEAELELA